MAKNPRVVMLNANESFGGGEQFLNLFHHGLAGFNYSSWLYSDCTLNHPTQLSNIPTISRLEIDDILIFNGVGTIYKYLFKFRRNKYKIFIQHSLVHDMQGGFFRSIIRICILGMVLRGFQSVVRVCKASLPNYLAPKIETVHNGIDMAYPRRVKGSSSVFKVAIVGILNDNKNQIAGLEIIKNLAFETVIYLIGTGPNEQQLINYVFNNDLMEKVVFTGHVGEPRRLLQDVDVLLITSLYEAFPLVGLEALSMGIPIVANNIGGMDEMIIHGENGFLVNGNSIAEYCDYLGKIHASNAIYLKLSDGAYSSCFEKFSLHKMARNYIDIIERIKNVYKK